VGGDRRVVAHGLVGSSLGLGGSSPAGPAVLGSVGSMSWSAVGPASTGTCGTDGPRPRDAGGATGWAIIVDRSGSLVRLENVGTISALAVQTTGATAPPSGSTIAIDTSTNTAGLSLLSYQGAGLAAAPVDLAGFVDLGDAIIGSRRIASLLDVSG